MKLPEGWPTREMIAAGRKITSEPRIHSASAVFKAMFAAAPTPLAQPEIDALENELSLRAHGEKSARIRVEMLKKEIDALKAENEWLRKDAERYQITEDALESAYWDFDARQKMSGEYSESSRAERDNFKWAIRKFIQTPAAQEDKPVYQHKAGWYGDDVWVDIGDLRYEALKANDVQVRKLYTRPSDDKLRKAAEEALKFCEIFIGMSDYEDAAAERIAKNLRAALEGR